MSKITLGYARCSTGRQAEGETLDVQEARIRAYCAAKGWDQVEVLVERGKSGKSVRRPLFQKMLRMVEAGEVAGVVVLRLDRFARSTYDLLTTLKTFKAHGTAFVSVQESIDTGSSLGEFTITLLGALATLESSRIGERTATVLQDLRQEGRVYCAKAPLGFRQVGNKFVPIPEAVKVIREGVKMREAGKSWNAIGAYFNSQGLKPRGKGKWFPASVRQVILSKATRELVAA